MPSSELKKLVSMLMTTFPGERRLKKEEVETSWNLMFSSSMHHADEAHRNKEEWRYMSTKELLGALM